MSKYNNCEGCKLWNGHHCIGARSYEPNSDEHRIICNEHMAKQFWVVYQQLHRFEARVKELEEKNNHLTDVNKKVKEKLNAQFAEMEEKLTAEENKNYELKEKLKMAEEALIEQDNYFKEIENIINKYKLTESVIKVTSINPLDVQEILNITRKAKGVK